MALPDQIDPTNAHKPAEEAGAEERGGKLDIDRDILQVGKGPTISVGDLQSRVEAAFLPPPAESETKAQATPIPAEEPEPERWSPRIQFAAIFGGSALGWALILTPFLVF
jgi:hypothetical protein